MTSGRPGVRRFIGNQTGIITDPAPSRFSSGAVRVRPSSMLAGHGSGRVFAAMIASLALAVSFLAISPAWAGKIGDGGIVADVEKGMMFLAVDGSGDMDAFLARERLHDTVPVTLGSTTLQTLKARLKGEVSGSVKVDVDYDSTQVKALRKLEVGYDRDNFSLKVGDMGTSLPGLEFPVTSRSLLGVRAAHRDGDGGFTFYAARLTTSFATENLVGDGTPGPFFLRHYPVESLSERVYVENELRVRGVHYELDDRTGVMKFKEDLRENAAIRVDYEHTDPFGSGGNYLSAARYRRKTGFGALGTFMAFQRETTPSDGGPLESQEAVFGFDTRAKLPGNIAVTAEFAANTGRQKSGSDILGEPDLYGGVTALGTGDNPSLDGAVQGDGDSDPGKAFKVTADLTRGRLKAQASLRQVDADFRALGNPNFDNNRRWFGVKTAFSPRDGVKLGASFSGEERNIDGSEATSPGRNDIEASVETQVPWKGHPLLTYTARRADRKTEKRESGSNHTNTDGLAKVVWDGDEDLFRTSEWSRDTSHALDLKYRVRRALVKSGVEFVQSRDLVEASRSSDDLKGRVEVRTRLAGKVVGTFKCEVTDHNGLEGDTGATRLGSVGLEADLMKRLSITTSYMARERDFLLDSRDTTASMRLSTKGMGPLTARFTLEQKKLETDGADSTGARVLSTDLGYEVSRKLRIGGEFILRREDGGTGSREDEVRAFLDWDLGRNFNLLAEVRDIGRQTPGASGDYDGTIRYLKATGRF